MLAAVNTKESPHRELRFATIDELKAEIDRVESAVEVDAAQANGNWSVGQICQHVGKFVMFSIDGFDGKAPWIVRVVAQLLFKKQALGPKPMPRGIQLPKQAASMLPEPEIAAGDGIAFLRAQLARIDAGERMTQPSPIFGSMTHDQWMHVHLKHAAGHLGFVSYGSDHG